MFDAYDYIVDEHNKLPDAPLKYKVGSDNGYKDVNGKDYKGWPVIIYRSFRETPNIGQLLPLDKEKAVGDDDENKFFYIEAKETMDPTTGKLIISGVLLGGGGEVRNLCLFILRNFMESPLIFMKLTRTCFVRDMFPIELEYG